MSRVNTSAASCNEALYSPMIVAVGLLGPLPRSDIPLQATYTLGRCQTSMMCGQKCSQIFVRIWKSLPMSRVNTSAASCNEALYSPMIVAVGLLGPLPRSDNPLQATYTLGRCQTSMMCGQKCSQIFVRIWKSRPMSRVNTSAASCNEALYSPMIVAVGLLGPLPRSDIPLQATYTLGRCQTSMMCGQKCSQIFVRIWKSLPPDKSEYQCSILQWGTVFTNDCCSRLVGSITKVWQPFTSYIHTGKMPDINDVWSKM